MGFGMMRLPVIAGGTGRENPGSPIDQEAVNEMVDYALFLDHFCIEGRVVNRHLYHLAGIL